MIKENALIQKLLTLNLPTEDYVLFGTAPLFLRGIKDLGHDLDLVARGRAWEMAAQAGIVEIPRSGAGHVISLFDGEIEVFDSWTPGVWDVDKLIETAETAEGIRFARLEVEHLKMIEVYLDSGSK